MSELKQYISEMLAAPVNKVVLSHPKSESEAYKKISIVKKKDFYQIEKYTDKQVFHENLAANELPERVLELVDGHYLQVNAFTAELEYALLISKKGKCTM
ncbi:MAG: SAM-dependent methyltransferase, partial [Peptococcaceae bacterium]|nr:SAM-dependent methyltransferase [Peptococcaceae bacterium]